MKRFNTQRARRRQGFTLIELLIVLAILVGLMALVAPKIFKTQEKAEIKNAQVQIGLFKGALEHYQLDTRALPLTEQGLQALVQPSAASDETGGGASGWDGPYVEEIPPDPWGTPYNYEYPPTRGSGRNPDIWSYGPDREDGTEDDIVSWTSAATGEDGDLMDEGFDEPPMDQFNQDPPPLREATPLGGSSALPPPPPPAP